ncbi:MAG: ATP-binding protein, partial [Mariprofundaceae bacterium]|nr:ATP-binding protein [Mariprofundaceae bacterium]
MIRTSTRQFKAHDNILLHTIKRQAGTFPKGVLEGTMNGIESGASRIDLLLEYDDSGVHFQIKDDGRGIATKQELIEHFEYFATPHGEDEEKIWAEFRMGRAQLFCFGRNVW